MDAAAKPAGKKAQPPSGGADAQAQPAEETPSSTPPEPDDAVAGCEEEDDAEQVERFYALLDNIRAMRGMLGGGTGTGTAAAAAGRRKRRAPEAAEAPWRPAFRMEDFEVEEVEEKGKIDDRTESSGCGATADDDEEDGGEAVVEAEGPPRKARRAGVC
ncbi:hypothetical protein U9M48_043711 [Paspalum notatum var. saurae]|uniref:Uncharacterized protein n=1 Tax=Paspalum notatum var. saurae TaxID=547442 RepID=A0AAQ3XHL6_PASNO